MSEDSDQELKVHLIDSDDSFKVEEMKSPQIKGARITNANLFEEKKLEMQDLSVRHQTQLMSTPAFKRSFTLRPNTMAHGSSSGHDSEGQRGQTINSKNTVTASMNFPRSGGSAGFNVLGGRPGGTNMPTQQRDKSDGRASLDSNFMRKQKQRMIRNMVIFNFVEPFLIILLMLNSVFYPNFGTAVYFVFSILLTALMLNKDEKRIKMKQMLSIAIIGLSVAILITKAIVIVDLHKQGDLDLEQDDILMYKTSGIYINESTTKIKVVNVFMSIFFDFIEIFLCILMTVLYGSQRKDVRAPIRPDGSGQYLLNPSFEKHQGKFCVTALIFITIDAIMVQTVFQVTIILLLLALMAVWALEKYERNSIRHLIVTYSAGILLLQLSITFAFQLPLVHYEITNSGFTMACDMFGLLLHHIKTYAVVVHVISIVISVVIVQLYRVTRASSLRNLPQGFMPADDGHPQGRESDHNIKMRTLQPKKKALDRGRTFVPSNMKATMKGTVVGKFRERTLGLRQRLDESSVQIVATQVYKDFSPQIWLWLCRISAFLWCHVYHDWQSWVILLWILQSTVFKSTKKFATITNMLYLPVFVAIFLFYYIINIPGVVQYQAMNDDISEWRNYGFYEFSIPFLETGLMFAALIPFFLFMKSSQKYLSFNKDDQKKKFLQKLTDEKAPTFYYFVFSLIKNLDLIVFIAIFFSGVNKIDFYHIFLMFFFVAYVVWPKCFKRNYIILLYYVDFFVLEKYFYTLILHYLPQDGAFFQFADVMGFDTDYDDNNKYFRLAPKFQQWLLIILVFIQYQVYRLLHDEKQVEQFQINATNNFKARYPRIYHIWELLQHLKKEFLILICFVIFFMMIILTTKSIINWGFQIIICIFMITYVAVGNNAPPHTGIRRLDAVWNMIIYYSALVLILQITYQFAALPVVRKGLELDVILDMLPSWIRKNLGIIGFQVYSKYIWQKFLVYLLYFSIGVYVRRELNRWNLEIALQNKDIMRLDDKDDSRNSDMQEDYFQDKANLDWEKEYLKIRFTTPYLVFKLKKIWVVLDKLSQILFVVISIMIMVLSNYWQISLSMAIHLSVFIGLCLVISSRLYQNRKKEKILYKGKGTLTVEEVGEHWTKYKRVVNEHQVKLRQRAWFFQFVVTLLCIALLYPTEFLYYIRKTFTEEGDMEVVTILDYLIFYLFWGGIYHSPWEISNHWYFYNIWGYLVILILLIFEKNAQQWALNRFGCSEKKVEWFNEIEKNLHKPKEKRVTIAEQAIQEEEEENSDQSNDNRLSQKKLKMLGYNNRKSKGSKSSSEKSERGSNSMQMGKSEEEDDENDPNKDLSTTYLREEIRRWLRKRYKIKILNGVKILLEDFIQLLLLISSVYKDSIIGLILLLGVFIYMTRRKIRTMVRIAWITGFCMILQYGLALSNLTSLNNPMDFPYPFDPYPSEQEKEGRFFIPWYLKIPLLRDSLRWSLYLGMGISNTKLNGLWIDYAIMGFIQAHLFYFGCQLFSIDYKVVKGDYLNEIFDDYCKAVHGECSPETIKRETRKLKHSIFFYNFYKGMQLSIFMHFHQVTIVVTLLLAILARSLFSFGYIIVCMIMIYENHKFFRKEQKNFRLQNVLKYWLRPYVFIDITLQLIFQIPLPFIHEGQDIRWSWQNIIGFQEIWIMDSENQEAITRSIIFIILKTFTYFFVTLQIQIFSSTAYKKYIKKDLVKFIDMAETKGMSIRMKFNNEKIEKIRKQTIEKKKMDDMLKKLRKLIKKWQAQFYDQDHETHEITPKSTTTPQQQKSIMSHSQIHNQSTHKKLEEKRFDEDKQGDDYTLKQQNSINSLPTFRQKQVQVQKPPVTKNFESLTYSDSRSSRLPQIMEEDEFSMRDDIEILEKLKKKLGFLAKGLLWLKKKHTEQIIFINSESFLKRVAEDMLACKTNIYTKMERKMLKDIRELKKQRLNSSSLEEDDQLQDIEIKDLQRTQEYIRFGGLLKGYLAVILEILVSYSDSVCYLLMIISMMTNAGLISIVYPFIVFGYALMEEINPKKKFWYSILIYTEFLILIKFLFQLQFWEALFELEQIQDFQDLLNAWHIGLTRQASGAFGDMLAYFLPEILILFAIMSHIQKEMISGMLQLKETELEGIEEALLRCLKYSREQIRSAQRKGSPIPHNIISSTLGEEEEEEVNPLTVELKKDVKQFFRSFPLNNSFNIPEEALKHLSPIESEDENFAILADQPYELLKKNNQRRNSMVDQKELRKIFNELQEQDLIQQEIKTGLVQRVKTTMQGILYKNQFFARLFPAVKEQKPGKDLYALIATFQFLICLFLIFFYTKMDADVTNISDAMTYNQFSGQMVIALFMQIAVMILDRYLYKSKTFIQSQEKERRKKNVKQEQSTVAEADKQSIVDPSQDRGKSFIQFLKKDTHVKSLIGKAKVKQHEELSSSEEEEERRQLERQIVLEQTKITFAIVSKFYLQWILLIFIHIFVFWYFPIAGNYKLQNHAYCDKKSIIDCNEFGENWALVIFYLLYCAYFWVSSLQIRFGLPEMKKGNFMMNDYGRVNTFAFKGFMAVPFLFELKTFADWTFTRTALDVFQWFILSATHAELFIARCIQGRYRQKPLGKPIQPLMKMALGVMGQFGIILLIAGPLLLFSTFNPISEKNPVINAQVKLNILIQQENSLAINTINLFTNNYVTELSEVTQKQYSVMKFGNELRTKSYDIELIQYVKMNNFSDTNWGVSLPNRQSLQEEFREAAGSIGNTSIKLQFSYQFERSNQNAATSSHSFDVDLRKPEYFNVVRAFNKTLSLDCSQNSTLNNSFIVPPFFTSVHLLSDKEDAVPQRLANWTKGLRIFYSCKDYWIVDQVVPPTCYEKQLPQSNLTGVSFFTFSNRISPSYFKYSILTFYISIVLVIGKLIRNVLVIGGNRIFIYEIPNSEQLLMLCECIYIYRLRSQLDQEEELYFTFVDIMRSPEMIKAITGSAIKKKTQ